MARAGKKTQTNTAAVNIGILQGPVYDPCCVSSGMFVRSEELIEAHAAKLGDISVCGHASSYTTRRLAKMNLAIRSVEARIAHEFQ